MPKTNNMKMIKVITTTVIAVTLGFTTLMAQEAEMRSPIHFGAKVGLNISNIYQSTNHDINTSGVIGLVTGAFVQIPIIRRFGIQPEVLFSQRGYNAKSTNPNNAFNVDRTLSYLDLPVMATFSPNSTFTVMAGPQLSIYLKQHDAYINRSTETKPEDYINDNRGSALSFLTGADVNLSNWVVSGRFGWDISKNDFNEQDNSPEYKNVWVQTTLGFKF